MSNVVTDIVVASVVSAFGTGGVVALWFRWRMAKDRLDVVEGPAARVAEAQATNAILLETLRQQEERHARERRELREEMNGLRDTVSKMGARLDAQRDLIDERDATIDRLTRQLATANDHIASLESQVTDLVEKYERGPKRATDRRDSPRDVSAG